MTQVLAFAAYLVLPLIGIGIWRLEAVRRLNLPARIGVALAAGTLITGAAMTLMSIVHVGWSRTALVLVLGAIAAVGARGSAPGTRAGIGRAAARPYIVGMAIVALLTMYGLLDARESCGDLHFFWGPKAIRFYRDGGINLHWLADPNTVRMNPGYPLLLPLIYAWSHTVAQQFSWWAAVLSSALFLFGAVAIVRGASGDDRGALLMATTLSYAFAVAFAGGAAEAPLILFETLTIVALTFLDSPLLASIGLAGAAMMKMEGGTFVIAVVIADLIVRRSVKRTAAIAAPAAVLLGAWVGLIKAYGITEYYRGAAMPVYLAGLPKFFASMAKAASYELWGLPWLVPAVLVAMGNVRRALFPLLVMLLTLGVAIFFYIHLPDPEWWILSSAPRVLLTPLTALLIAGVCAWYSRPAHGVVSQGEKA
jgi:hypothetical protein